MRRRKDFSMPFSPGRWWNVYFTEGKDLEYEKMMREIPGFNRGEIKPQEKKQRSSRLTYNRKKCLQKRKGKPGEKSVLLQKWGDIVFPPSPYNPQPCYLPYYQPKEEFQALDNKAESEYNGGKYEEKGQQLQWSVRELSL